MEYAGIAKGTWGKTTEEIEEELKKDRDSNHIRPAILNLSRASGNFSEPKDSCQFYRMTEKHLILLHNYEANAE